MGMSSDLGVPTVVASFCGENRAAGFRCTLYSVLEERQLEGFLSFSSIWACLLLPSSDF